MSIITDLLGGSRKGNTKDQGFDSTHELHPTFIDSTFDKGIIRSTDGSAWILRKVRLSPYADAVTLREQLASVDSIMMSLSLLAGMADTMVASRFLSKGTYRHIQLELVNVPRYFEPDPKSPLASKHARDYRDRVTDERLLLVAVALKQSSLGMGARGWVESEAESIVYGGVPMVNFHRDAEEVSGMLDRAGMTIPTSEEIRLADSWWSDARRSDSHFARHPDHLHVFRNASSAAAARSHWETPCEEWPRITGHSVLTIATVTDFNLKFTPSALPYTQWISDAIKHGAVAISIRGAIEPAKISGEEMRKQFKKVRGDIEEATKANKIARGEREENLQLLASISSAYDKGGFPTLHDASVLIAFNGRREERKLMQSSAATVRLMENLQLQGLKEMQLGSPVRANPNKHELPSPVIACSGITSLNRVGDRKGVLLGFDERDQQPAYLDHMASSNSDAAPIMFILAATGAGKECELSTVVPTPNGMTTIGALTSGDVVLGRDGKSCTVTNLSPIRTPDVAYEITLADGQSYVAGSNHQWVVSGGNLTHLAEMSAIAEIARARAIEVVRIPTLVGELAAAGVELNAQMVDAMLDMMDTPRTEDGEVDAHKALVDLTQRTTQQRTALLGEVVLSTAEIIASGSAWSLPIARAVEMFDGDALDARSARFEGLTGRAPEGVFILRGEQAREVIVLARSLGAYVDDAGAGSIRFDFEVVSQAIVTIEPIEPVPMRCLTVDSPDSTYLVGDFVPTHNTMVALNIADQLQGMSSPAVIIDPKTHTEGEGHGPVVRAMGGNVASLDSLLDADGVFDPVRFTADPQSSVEISTDLLLQINPWGHLKDSYEVSLSGALQHGIVDRGARCLGEALKYAFDDGMLKGYEDVFHKCEQLKDSSPLFGALYGRDPKGDALSINDGVTLIEVGKTSLPVPEPGTAPDTITKRVAAALVRMMVFGSASAMTGRFGTVILDEAWVFLSAGKTEVERLGRLARSQKVFPILLTQKVTDAVKAGLEGYISRGLIMHLSDPTEARAALQLFKVEQTSDRIERITARERADADDDDSGTNSGLNPKSLKALVASEPDPRFEGMMKRTVRRGAVAYYSDLSGRFIPVEMVLPEEFLLMASTNPLDIQRRERVLATRRREQAMRRRRAETTDVGVDEFDALLNPKADSREDVESLFEVRADQSVTADASRTDRDEQAPTGPTEEWIFG